MQRYITNVECISNSFKGTSGSSSRKQDEISFSKIFFLKYLENVRLTSRNYKNLNRRKIVRFKTSSFLSAEYFLVTATTISFNRTKKCPRNITNLDKFLSKVQNISA